MYLSYFWIYSNNFCTNFLTSLNSLLLTYLLCFLNLWLSFSANQQQDSKLAMFTYYVISGIAFISLTNFRFCICYLVFCLFGYRNDFIFFYSKADLFCRYPSWFCRNCRKFKSPCHDNFNNLKYLEWFPGTLKKFCLWTKISLFLPLTSV